LTEPRAYRLDDKRALWNQFVENKRRAKQIKNWIDEFGDAIKTLAGDAKELTLGGMPVANIVAGQLNKTELAKEQPDIVKECTVTKTVERFDEGLFKQLYPDMYEKYRAQRLVLKGETPD
jgi:hypothetical protein